MDEPAAYGPSRRMAGVLAAAAVVAAIEALLTHAATGRLLLGIVAVALAVIAASDLIFWPRLLVTRKGITIYSATLRTRLPWTEISEIRVDERVRHGLTSRALEIESGDLLMVFGKRSLGRDPAEVLEQVARRCP